VNRFYEGGFIDNPQLNIIKLNQKLFSIILSQKSQNLKCTFKDTNTVNTFTTGTTLKCFDFFLPKGLRRDIKSIKMFLNFLRLLLEKKYKHNLTKSTLLFNVVGFNYSMLVLKKNIKDLVLSIKYGGEVFSIFKVKIPFTKKKIKRLKSIKKRLKKSILLNFLKKINVKLF
jgi:hypothetical protein